MRKITSEEYHQRFMASPGIWRGTIHDRPHRGVENRTPHEAFLDFAVLTKNQALNV